MLVSSRFLKFWEIVMRCELSVFGMLFHGVLQNHSTVHKQNTKPESNSQEVTVIIECYKDFHLYDKFLLSWAYSRVRPIKKKILCKRKEFLLVWAKKIFILPFVTLGMDLVIMSDIKGTLCLMLSFMSWIIDGWSMYVIMMHDKKGVMSCFVR